MVAQTIKSITTSFVENYKYRPVPCGFNYFSLRRLFDENVLLGCFCKGFSIYKVIIPIIHHIREKILQQHKHNGIKLPAKMSEIPFVLSLDTPAYYGHDVFPNRIYRQLHARHHDSLDLHTLGLIARLGAHAHHNRKLAEDGAGSYLKNDKNEFEINLDVGYFAPNELSVKVVNDCIVVEGKHEEREDDHGFISRHFARRYALPKNYNVDNIMSTLSSDGVLTVHVPKPKLEDKSNERVIEIKQIGPSDLFLKNNKKSEEEPKKDE